MGKAYFLPFDSLAIRNRGDGMTTRSLVTSELDAHQFRSGMTQVRVGGAVPAHSHNCEEQVTLLRGELEVRTADLTCRLRPLDSTFIPAGVSHQFINVGSEPALLLFVYGSSKVTRTFTETGETVEHLSDRDIVQPSS